MFPCMLIKYMLKEVSLCPSLQLAVTGILIHYPWAYKQM